MIATPAFATRTIAGAGAKPHLLVTAGVHGDEFEPMAAVRELIRALDPMRPRLRGRVTLAPVVNEAAFLRGQRTAEDGLDLARTCPGRADGTITERVAASLSQLIRAADYYIDLHTGGTGLELVPLAGYMLHADQGIRAVQRRIACAFGLPLVWGTSSDLHGRSLSVARDAAVPAIYIEHGGGGAYNPGAVRELTTGCLRVMMEIGMFDPSERSTPSRACHVVEDDRAGSGHLQVQHPSPRDGFFEPSVRLGQSVRAGEAIGTVTDALGDVVEAVHAAQSGMILMLRALRSVRRDDPLAAIVDASPVGGVSATVQLGET